MLAVNSTPSYFLYQKKIKYFDNYYSKIERREKREGQGRGGAGNLLMYFKPSFFLAFIASKFPILF